jgi:hypothetical protein
MEKRIMWPNANSGAQMNFLIASFVLAFGWRAAAAQDFGCMQSCFARGFERSDCITICGGSGAGGLTDQTGLPKNPAFETIAPKTQAPPLPKVVDPKCYQDCRKRNYHPQLCQRQCSWGGSGYRD